MIRPIYLFNTLSRAKELFASIEKDKIGMYTCGPTVYGRAHIGNLRTYIFEDVARRFLENSGYVINHVMNITDVGHLESDADEGEDKMMIAAKRDQKSPWDIARHFEDVFFNDCRELNIIRPHKVCRAIEHIEEMIEFVQALEKKGFAYVVEGNVYFDTSKFPTYSDFARLNLGQMQDYARVDQDQRKRNPQDFVLWFSQSKFPNQIMKWDSPWGTGFPGWHIECSAMASKYLGPHIDLHCGGIDHIPMHHTNEIAQSEARFGHKWVNYWMHGEFLVLDKGKMSKSKGGTLTISTLKDNGYNPIHFRYLCLTTHYRSQLKFSYESLDGARNAYETLENKAREWSQLPSRPLTQVENSIVSEYEKQFWDALADDLNMPIALSKVWVCARDDRLSEIAKRSFIQQTALVLGLNLTGLPKDEVALTAEQQRLVQERTEARAKKDWKRGDELRRLLEQQGVSLQDNATGTDYSVKKNISNKLGL